MQLYPALDILGGKCVRLRKGRFEDKTVYSEDLPSVIQGFQNAGAQNLHLVDLSGAQDPSKGQTSLIHDLVSKSLLKIQCGGGIRTFQQAQSLLESGVDRVVLGSMAIIQPSVLKTLIREFGPDRFTVALDVRKLDSYLLTVHGWETSTEIDLFEWIHNYQDTGFNRILCTDIGRDGMMTGPNFALYEELIERFPEIQIQASGGISSLQDLRKLKDTGVHSVIAGKALYEGLFTLQEALTLC